MDLREALKSVRMDLESVVVAGDEYDVGVVTIVFLAYLWEVDFCRSCRVGCGLLNHSRFDSPWHGSLGHDR